MNEYLTQEFDLNDKNFVSCLDELSFWSAPFGIKLLEVIPLNNCSNVLDIGCGTGFPLLEIAMRLGPKSHITGIDPWKAGIQRIRDRIAQYGIANISLIEGVAENMQLPSNHFDLLVSNNGINNVQNLQQVFKECNRVSTQGAEFIWTMNTDGSFKPFYETFKALIIEKNIKNSLENIDQHIYLKRRPVTEMKTRLIDAGFAIRSIEESSFSYRFASGSAMFRHTFIRLAFLESWKKLVPANQMVEIFTELEKRLDVISDRNGELKMEIPFVLFRCVKI
jgi:ubiquinone/menaquinone biosynthesis C-methylase UbiE